MKESRANVENILFTIYVAKNADLIVVNRLFALSAAASFTLVGVFQLTMS